MSTRGMSTRVSVMTRRNCSACARAEDDVRRICDELGVGWELCDVDTDPEWRAEYGDHVPVVLLDGAEHSYWAVEEDRLRSALA